MYRNLFCPKKKYSIQILYDEKNDWLLWYNNVKLYMFYSLVLLILNSESLYNEEVSLPLCFVQRKTLTSNPNDERFSDCFLFIDESEYAYRQSVVT